MDEAPGDRPAALLDPPQLDGAALALPRFHVAAEAAEAGPLPGEGAAFPLEGVEVEVDVHHGDGLGAAVAPGKPLAPVDGVLQRIERRLEVVAGDALGALAVPHAAPGSRA